jgi:hypothetical protein
MCLDSITPICVLSKMQKGEDEELQLIHIVSAFSRRKWLRAIKSRIENATNNR